MVESKKIIASLSLAFGIIAVLTHVFVHSPIAWFFDIIAVTLGIIGLVKIKGQQAGLMGMCIIGIVLGTISALLLFLVYLLFTITPMRNMNLFT